MTSDPPEGSASLVGRLLALADTRGGDAALIGRDGRVVTFGELAAWSGGLAGRLRECGVREGDRVLLLVPVTPDLYALLAALWTLGAVAVLLDPSAGRAHVERCLRLARPAAFVGVPRAHLLRLVVPALREVPLQFSLVRSGPGGTRRGAGVPGAVSLTPGASVPPVPLLPDAPALLTFTSGSTGLPKGAVRTHGFLATQHAALADALKLRSGTRDLTTLPVVALANLASGVTCLMPDVDLRRPHAADVTGLRRQLRRWRPVSTAMSPALAERLAREALERGETLPLRQVFVGGGPVFPRVLDLLTRVCPDAEIVSVYGSTEAEPIAHWAHGQTTPQDLAAMLAGGGLLAGPAVPQITLRVLPDRWGAPLPYTTRAELEADALGMGRTGELVVSGDHVLSGYLDARGDAETKWRDETGRVWHRTGDAGRLDGQGRLWLMGRCSARVHDERGELYPFAVEVAAHAHAGVDRAALVGRGGRRVLWVCWRGRRDPEGLAARLAWAELDEVRTVRALPLDGRHGAKIDYARLSRMS